MPPFPYLIIVLLFLFLFLATISAQTTTPESPSPPTTTSPRRRGHHRRNAAKFFGYVRTNDTAWFNNQTLIADEFVHAHNWVRSQYQLPLYTWDEKLASYAREYLMQRYEDCKLIHSNSEYGENMFWGRNLHWTPSDAVYYWYLEKKNLNYTSFACLPGLMCEHFTQVVWKDSLRLGCGLQHCHKPGGGMLIACEYDPPGNYVNENPFQAHT